VYKGAVQRKQDLGSQKSVRVNPESKEKRVGGLGPDVD
jgi:hypothetical protein